MPSTLPPHPNIKRQLKARLLDLTPRAFELFAGELLVYVGLDRVQVTRYVGDGGIDAHGEIVTGSGIIRIPTGVQVKRHRNNVQRSDIDRFIGALSGHYSEGIFITTAGYAQQAIVKAGQSIPRVSPIDGEQVVSMMLRHRLGVASSSSNDELLDESYFVAFEEQTRLISHAIREESAGYQINRQSEPTQQQAGIEVRPEDDLISLRALSYVLRIDTTTIRRWIGSGKLRPDRSLGIQAQEGFFFRRDRVETIKEQLTHDSAPVEGSEWRQEFLDFANSRNLTKSYKPVLLKALMKLVNRDGEAHIEDLIREFRAFYVQRQQQGLPIEFDVPLLVDPEHASDAKLRQLIAKYPLDRFLIKGFLTYQPATGLVRFEPTLWRELRYYELVDILAQADEQLRYYYDRHV